MSEATQNSNTPYIPDGSEVESTTGRGMWRFSEGQIVRGPEEQLETTAKLVGIIRRVGIHRGKIGTPNGGSRPYMKVECDIETRDGLMFVGQNLLSQETMEVKPTRAALDFAWCLTQVEAEKVYEFTASQGEAWTDEMGRPRKASTYVNLGVVEQVAGQWKSKPIYKPKRDRNAPKQTAEEQWAQLEEEIRSHPLFAERPDKREDDEADSQRELLRALCVERGWPTDAQNPSGWLVQMQAAFPDAQIKSLDEIDDQIWGMTREAFTKLDKCPSKIAPAVAQGAFA